MLELLTPQAHPGRPYPERTGVRFPAIPTRTERGELKT